MPVHRRITQKALARLAGVSHMTVSLALRGHPRISAATRKRILTIARQQGYRPDPALAALNAYRLDRRETRYHGSLVWLTNFPTADGWKQGKQMEGYYLGAREQAEKLGYGLEEFWIGDPALTPARTSGILLNRGVAGLLVAPQPVPYSTIDLAWGEFSAVTLGYSLAQPQLHMVMNHQFRNMQRVVRELRGRGYRRMGIAMPSAYDERVDHNYLSGFWIESQGAKPAVAVEPLVTGRFDFERFRRWFGRQRPDAIVTATNWAVEVEAWLRRLDRRVPHDVGLAVPSIPFREARYAGVDENVRLIGSIAVDTLVGMAHRNERGVPRFPLRILVEGVWHDGATLRPAKG